METAANERNVCDRVQVTKHADTTDDDDVGVRRVSVA
jgi:hypothetical protein